MPSWPNLSSISCHVSIISRSIYPIIWWIQVNADTEIDWKTYMAQVELYIKGEHDYSRITGPTGPLVWVAFGFRLVNTPNTYECSYPAGHVHIHHFLRDITNSGENIIRAQYIYSALYITSLALTCAIYRQAGRTPNWLLLLLPLSKRIHSIFVLRLFNDCWSVVAVQMAILSFQNDWYDLGMLLFRCDVFIYFHEANYKVVLDIV